MNKRHELGSGALTFGRETSVFINCPFDSEYRPIFDAIVFSSLCCGFLPRCALETGSVSKPRMDRICNALIESKYSVHDLSRCRGEGDLNLARFNMPLELGIAMSQSRQSASDTNSHDWLVLVPSDHIYARYISDLAGYDPVEYDGSPTTAVPGVMAWLATRPDAVQTPTPQEVLAALPEFTGARLALCEAWCDQVPWVDVLTLGLDIGRGCGLIPNVDAGPNTV